MLWLPLLLLPLAALPLLLLPLVPPPSLLLLLLPPGLTGTQTRRTSSGAS
jgi:hypothetical protein